MGTVDWTNDRTGRLEWGRDGRKYTYARSLLPGDHLFGGFTVVTVEVDGSDVVVGWTDPLGGQGESLRDRFTEMELVVR